MLSNDEEISDLSDLRRPRKTDAYARRTHRAFLWTVLPGLRRPWLAFPCDVRMCPRLSIHSKAAGSDWFSAEAFRQMALPLRIRAVNTAPDSENKIHDDSVAAQYGFRGGLVPGVTVYGYMAAAAIEHFGLEWLDRGAMDVRFRQPVYEDDEVVVSLETPGDGRVQVKAGEAASAEAWIHSGAWDDPTAYKDVPVERRAPSVETLAPGTQLGTLFRRLDLAQSRISAPLDPFIGRDRLAHPAVLLSLANEILMTNYELGPWMHAASEVRNFSSARDGEAIRVQARIKDRFERKGHEFVVLDVVALGEDRAIGQVRHTAIWLPRKVMNESPREGS